MTVTLVATSIGGESVLEVTSGGFAVGGRHLFDANGNPLFETGGSYDVEQLVGQIARFSIDTYYARYRCSSGCDHVGGQPTQGTWYSGLGPFFVYGRINNSFIRLGSYGSSSWKEPTKPSHYFLYRGDYYDNGGDAYSSGTYRCAEAFTTHTWVHRDYAAGSASDRYRAVIIEFRFNKGGAISANCSGRIADLIFYLFKMKGVR